MATKPLVLTLDVQRNTESDSVPSDEKFELWVQTALSGRREQADLVIRIVDTAEACQFNLQYRDKHYATNVLSFPAQLPEGIPAEAAGYGMGDLLICSQVVSDEARQQNKTERDHWTHLVVHGVLHLLGHDHELESEAIVMEALEIEILNELGVSNPYHDY